MYTAMAAYYNMLQEWLRPPPEKAVVKARKAKVREPRMEANKAVDAAVAVAAAPKERGKAKETVKASHHLEAKDKVTTPRYATNT